MADVNLVIGSCHQSPPPATRPDRVKTKKPMMPVTIRNYQQEAEHKSCKVITYYSKVMSNTIHQNSDNLTKVRWENMCIYEASKSLRFLDHESNFSRLDIKVFSRRTNDSQNLWYETLAIDD